MKYSVIVPVYNAEKTIRRCVDSLLSQLHADAEIILVNDGSQDASNTICEGYAGSHQNVRLISQQNAGVSAARNAGLSAARGEYMHFVDSDDYVIPGFFQNIDRIVNETDADLIQFSCYIDSEKRKRKVLRRSLRADSREKLMPHIVDAMCGKTINGPWAKLFKRSLIEMHSIRFPTGVSVGEDGVFNIVYSFHIHNYVRMGYLGYVLNIENKESLSRRRHNDLEKQNEIANEHLNRELASAEIPEREKECYRQAFNFDECIEIYHDAKMMIIDRERWLLRQKRLKKLCRSINEKHMEYPKTAYCSLMTFPIRFYLTPMIDAVAWGLIHCAG